MTRVSFAKFRATRTRCNDLGKALGDATLTAQGGKGFLYLSQPGSFTGGYTGGLYIEDAGCGEYRLQLDEDVEVTSDLEGLERRLYHFAVGSGLIEADRFAVALENFASAAHAVIALDDGRKQDGPGYRATKCPCGDPICKAWHVSGVASVQGVSFEERQARIVADLLNAIEPREEDPV
jgi:hypothetical protein